jgi:TPP-dependent pyruvate/acetoin dehydrogenase alpha subunit
MNNEYGMGTSVERASAVTDLYRRAAAYDLPPSASTATTC